MTDTPAAARPIWHRPLDVRRVVLGHLLAAAGPVALDDLVAAAVAAFGDWYATPIGRTEVAECVRHQIRYRRVRRVRRGVYEYVPGSLSRSTEWRCRTWSTQHSRASAEHEALGTAAGSVGSPDGW